MDTVTDKDPASGRRRADWQIVGVIVGLIGVGAAGWSVARIITRPSTEEAMRLSLAEMRMPELSTAYTLHPDACSITKNLWKWTVGCEGVPIHFYQDLTLCDPGPPKSCGAVPADYKNCRSYYWDIDLDGKPSNPIGDRGRYASIEETCRPKGAIASEREEMARRGIAPNPVEILDYAGWYTGKPRGHPFAIQAVPR